MAENITYEKALEKSEELKALEFIVKAFVELTPKDGVMCSGCIWDNAIKPLALSVVGWERIPRDGDSSEYHGQMSSREAWDAVTEKWLAMLDAADPGRGHGVDAVAS